MRRKFRGQVPAQKRDPAPDDQPDQAPDDRSDERSDDRSDDASHQVPDDEPDPAADDGSTHAPDDNADDEPGAEPYDDELDDADIPALEDRVAALRRDPDKALLLPLLDWRLAKTRGEPVSPALGPRLVEPVRTLSARLVGRNDADDVTQEALVSFLLWIRKRPFLEVLALLESTDGVSRLLYRLTVCRAYDHHRRNKTRREQLATQDDQREIDASLTPTTPHQVIAPDLERVERAYASLPRLQRIAHILHHCYGFTDADFERTLGWNRASSRSLVSRANLAMKRLLKVAP